MLAELLRALEVGNAGLTAVTAGQRALQALNAGDMPAALDAAYTALGAANPRAESLARGIHGQIDAFRGGIVEGKFREIDDAPSVPWERFVRWVTEEQRYGGVVIIGPQGAGKTSLAFRLAERYMDAQGYDVRCVGVYPEDMRPWARKIDMGLVIEQMERLARTVAYADLDDDEISDAAAREIEKGVESEEELRDAFGGRVVIIDEAGLNVPSNPGHPANRAVRTALQHCRHVDWLPIYISQWAADIPKRILGLCTIYAKRPNAGQADMDRDNPYIRQIWYEAQEYFERLPRLPGYPRAPQAWAYVVSSAGGPGDYRGLAPFGRAG